MTLYLVGCQQFLETGNPSEGRVWSVIEARVAVLWEEFSYEFEGRGVGRFPEELVEMRSPVFAVGLNGRIQWLTGLRKWQGLVDGHWHPRIITAREAALNGRPVCQY